MTYLYSVQKKRNGFQHLPQWSVYSLNNYYNYLMKKSISTWLLLLFIHSCMAQHTLKSLQLTDFQTESVMKLSTLYGYARYFYPNPHIEEVDWYGFLEKEVQEIICQSSGKEVDSLLLARFSVFIPELTLSSDTLSSLPKSTDASFFIKENTLNTGWSKSVISGQIRKIDKPANGIPTPSTYYNFPLSSTTYASYPLAVETLPLRTPAIEQVLQESKKQWKKDFYTSPYFRIANAIINHTLIRHFYAYYEEDDLASVWQESFQTYIRQIANALSYQEYLEHTYRQYAQINDTHLYIMNGYNQPGAWIGKSASIYYPEISVARIENKICIRERTPRYPTLQAGDEVLSVNRIPVQELIREKLQFISASTESSRYEKLCNMFLFQSFRKDSVIHVEVRHDNGLTESVPVTINRQEPGFPQRKEFITEVEKGIWKIDPCADKGASYTAFSKHIENFRQAKGLIIDIRGYPQSCILPILSHFIDSTATVGQILTPTYRFPDHQRVSYQITPSSQWGIHPSVKEYDKAWEYEKPVPVRIHTPVVFLTDCRALSFAETIVELVKHYRIGPIIGEHTAGTNGDACIFRSPAVGYIFTAYKFLTHTGKRHHGIGVAPDIECPFLIEDLRNDRDTQTIKACETIEAICAGKD